MMRRLRSLGMLGAVLCLSACANRPPTPDGWSDIRMGMSREQVRSVVGEPLDSHQFTSDSRLNQPNEHEWCKTYDVFASPQVEEIWLYRSAGQKAFTIAFDGEGNVFSYSDER